MNLHAVCLWTAEIELKFGEIVLELLWTLIPTHWGGKNSVIWFCRMAETPENNNLILHLMRGTF